MQLRLSIASVLIVLFLGVVVSGVTNIYETVPYFDKLMHFTGGLVMAWFSYAFFYPHLQKLERHPRALFVVGVVALIGIAWEIAEYLSGAYLQKPLPLIYAYFHGGNLPDTLIDLALDVVGAKVFTLAFITRTRSR